MIRAIRTAAALTAVFGVASMATSPLIAASASRETRRSNFELTTPITGHTTASVNGPQLPAAALAKVTPAEVRKRLIEMQNGKGALSARAASLLRLLDVLESKDSAQRHERVMKLGVEVQRQQTDEGTLSSFIVRGVERLRTFHPTAVPFNPSKVVVSPDTANPTPILRTDCVPEEVAPEECATDQEIDDFAATLADIDAEAVGNISDIENGYWGAPESQPTSGPSADERFNCVIEALETLGGWLGVRSAVGTAGAAVFEIPAAQVTRAIILDALADLAGPITLALTATYVLYKCAAEMEPFAQEPIARPELMAARH